MRILQIIQKPQLRGAEVFAAQLSDHLRKMGHDVKIVSLMSGDAHLPFNGEIVTLGLSLSNRLIDYDGWRKLARIVKDFRPDVVQANAGDTLKYASLSKAIFRWNAPLIFRNANKVSDFVNSAPKRLFNRLLLLEVRHVVSVSELCRKDFVRTYLFDESCTTTVPIGIEDVVTSRALSDDVKVQFSSRKILLNVASLVPEKNHRALIELAARLRDANHDFLLVIVGDGRLRSFLESEIRCKGLADNVVLLGYRSDVLDLMRNASLFVLPSLVEGLPGVILEAFSVELPVVAYDVGGVCEIVVNEKTGWLVEKNDEDALFSSVAHVLKFRESAREITSNAHSLVRNDFMNKRIADKFLAVYKIVISS